MVGPSPRSPQPDPLLVAWRRTKDFLRERLETSGRSDVNINAVLREMNSAFDDSSTPIPSPRSPQPPLAGTLAPDPDGGDYAVWRSPQPDPLREALRDWLEHGAECGYASDTDFEDECHCGLVEALAALPVPCDTDLRAVLDAHVSRLMDLGRYMLNRTPETADYAEIGRLIAEAVNDYPELRRRAASLSSSESRETLDAAPERATLDEADRTLALAAALQEQYQDEIGDMEFALWETDAAKLIAAVPWLRAVLRAVPELTLDVDRLAWLIYVRCGDRDEATALRDAEALRLGLTLPEPIPDWFAARLTDSREQTAAPVEGMRE